MQESQDRDIRRLSAEINRLAHEVQSLRLISRELRDAYRQQSRRLAAARMQVRRCLAELRTKLVFQEKLGRPERRERSRLFVTAALLQFDARVFFVRWMADEDWLGESGRYATAQSDIREALARLEEDLASPTLQWSAPAYHLLAVDLRAWADRLSPEATTASGWLGAAAEISRELRLHAHHYRTRELWAQLREPLPNRPGPVRAVRLSAAALLRSLYGAVSGYGLSASRFVASVLALVSIFAVIYWLLDAQQANCAAGALSWPNGVNHLVLSLSVFTTLGVLGGPACSADTTALQRVASLESLAGYIMLGVLISVFWMAFHESATGVSGVRLPELRPTSVAAAVQPSKAGVGEPREQGTISPVGDGG